MIVKPMPVEDFDQTVMLLFENAKESGVDQVDEEFLIKELRQHIISPSSKLFALYLGQRVVGYCGIVMGSETLQSKVVGVINFLYVEQEYRNEETMKELLFPVFDWSKQFNCEKILLTANELPDQNELLTSVLSFKKEEFLIRGI